MLSRYETLSNHPRCLVGHHELLGRLPCGFALKLYSNNPWRIRSPRYVYKVLSVLDLSYSCKQHNTTPHNTTQHNTTQHNTNLQQHRQTQKVLFRHQTQTQGTVFYSVTTCASMMESVNKNCSSYHVSTSYHRVHMWV